MQKRINPYLVRSAVLLGGDICRFLVWVYILVDLITNYKNAFRYGKLRKSLPPTEWQICV